GVAKLGRGCCEGAGSDGRDDAGWFVASFTPAVTDLGGQTTARGSSTGGRSVGIFESNAPEERVAESRPGCSSEPARAGDSATGSGGRATIGAARLGARSCWAGVLSLAALAGACSRRAAIFSPATVLTKVATCEVVANRVPA